MLIGALVRLRGRIRWRLSWTLVAMTVIRRATRLWPVPEELYWDTPVSSMQARERIATKRRVGPEDSDFSVWVGSTIAVVMTFTVRRFYPREAPSLASVF